MGKTRGVLFNRHHLILIKTLLECLYSFWMPAVVLPWVIFRRIDVAERLLMITYRCVRVRFYVFLYFYLCLRVYLCTSICMCSWMARQGLKACTEQTGKLFIRHIQEICFCFSHLRDFDIEKDKVPEVWFFWFLTSALQTSRLLFQHGWALIYWFIVY